jgi:rod shape-determining protein MreD
MIKLVPSNILRFFVLVILQVAVLNNIHMGGFITPYIYILFIIMLPFETPAWLMLLLAFFTGITIDLFTNNIGLHASATVFMAFLRPQVLKLISPRDGYEPGTYPALRLQGVGWFIKYVIMIVLAHHLFLFYAEAFDFAYFFATFLRVILSSILTILLILLSQYLT